MNEIVRHKRAAAVTYGPAVPPLGARAVMAHRTRGGLLDAVRSRTRRGELQSVDGHSLRLEDGAWMIDVRVMPAAVRELRPRRRWPRVLLVAAPVFGLFGAVWWLAMALSAQALGAVLLLAVLLLWMLASRGRAGSAAIVVNQNVDIRR